MSSFIVSKYLAVLTLWIISLAASRWSQQNKFQVQVDPTEALEHAFSPHLAESLAGGLFFGIGLFHLWPESLSAWPWPHYFSITMDGFILLCVLVLSWWGFEKCIQWCSQHATADPSLSPMSYAFIAALAVHATLEGLTLAGAFDWKSGLIIFFAIFVHKAAECFAFTVHVQRYIASVNWQRIFIYIFISLTPVAILSGTLGLQLLSSLQRHLPYVQLLSASILIYLAMTHNLVHAVHDKHHRWPLLGLFFLGTIAMLFLSLTE